VRYLGTVDLPLAGLAQFPGNARRGDLQVIRASVARHGQYRSIVVRQLGDGSHVIVAGNHTALALAAEGHQTARADLIDCDEDEARRINLADNRSAELGGYDDQALAVLLSSLDGDFTGTGWAAEDLAALLRGEPESRTDPDDVPDAPAEPVTRPGDVWLLGPHRLLCGDATVAADVERLLNGASPSLMITDPPYGVDYDPNWRNEAAAQGHLAYAPSRVGKVANDTRVDWSDAWSLSPAHVVYCWHAGRHASSVQASLEAAGYEIRCQIIWAKSNFPISRGHYHWRHEPCWYAVRKDHQADWIGDRTQTTLWEINLDRNVEGGHSTQKPVECMLRGLRNHSGDVYDPFAGTGTTLIAAHMLGRTAYLLDIDPAYCDVIVQRYRDHTGVEPELESRASVAV
jgi:DNA modification methylase